MHNKRPNFTHECRTCSFDNDQGVQTSPKRKKLMRTHHLLATCALLAVSSSLLAQGMQVPLQNVAQMSTSGSVEVQQDLLAISLNTTASGSDANNVQSQLKQALDTALNQAKQAASPGQMDVRTGNFSLYPRYSKDNKINGWQGTAELVLEGRDFARITSTAGKIQTLTMGNVSFALSREQRARAEAEAQLQAIERFKVKALEVTKSFGFSAYTLRDVVINANDQGSIPRPRMMSMARSADMAESAVPVEAGKSTVVVNVTGSVQMR